MVIIGIDPYKRHTAMAIDEHELDRCAFAPINDGSRPREGRPAFPERSWATEVCQPMLIGNC